MPVLQEAHGFAGCGEQLVGGAVGGAALGLATKDRRRVALLAVLGALGLTLGVFATLTFGSFFNYSSALVGALVSAVLGASLGAEQ